MGAPPRRRRRQRCDPWRSRRGPTAHRLIVTWADPADRMRKDRHSRVTFDIETVADMVRLTVTHEDLEAGSNMERKITHGWPRVLSSLKSLLETGRPLQTWAGR
jgi:hypothetical protein